MFQRTVLRNSRRSQKLHCWDQICVKCAKEALLLLFSGYVFGSKLLLPPYPNISVDTIFESFK